MCVLHAGELCLTDVQQRGGAAVDPLQKHSARCAGMDINYVYFDNTFLDYFLSLYMQNMRRPPPL